MNQSYLDTIYDISGLSFNAPGKMIIPRSVLKKIIDAIGIRNTLRWINAEDRR